MDKKIVLTGIKPTGMPHLGNYIGAIKPAIQMADEPDTEARYFIADYHSLNTVRDADTLRTWTLEVAMAWLAAGLDPSKTLIYRQSDVPETFELATILSAFAAKGLLNRAHAYKAAVDANREKGYPDDHQINMGLYTYPILMAADILLFDTNYVPVGADQVQHVEMAKDMAEAVNHNYGKQILVLPKALVNREIPNVPGKDGRKMAKSYNNHIPLFLPEKQLRKSIMQIVTNSQGIEEPKNPENCNVFALYSLFANQEEKTALANRYLAGGMGWGEAKLQLFEKLNVAIASMREKYEALKSDPSQAEAILADGAVKAREVAGKNLSRIRKAVGAFPI